MNNTFKDFFQKAKQVLATDAVATPAFQRNAERNKYFFVLETGKTLNSHKDFIDRLKQRVHLQQVFTVADSDFILAFCPVVSRAGTDIEAAVKKLNHQSDTKPVVLVVLHHTFEPECVVPDSSRSVHRKNTITVDCLFHEDKGLLQCHKNNESLSKTVKYINPQKKVQGEKCAYTDKGSMKDTQQDQSVQINNPETVDSRTVERRDQQLNSNYPHIENEESLVEKMEKRLEEKQKEEREQLQEFKKCVETHNKKLQSAVKQIEEKTTQLRMVEEDLEKTYWKLDQKQTQLTDTERQLADKSKELETSKNTIMEREKLIQEKDRQIKDQETIIKQVTTAVDEKNQELEDSQRCMESEYTQLEKLLSEKETQLNNTHQDLKTSKNKLVTMEQELKKMINIKEQQETELKEKTKHLEEKNRLTTEYIKTLEEKDTQLREVKEELEKTTRILEVNQAEMKEKVRRLESVVKKIEQKLIGKDKQPHEKDKLLNETTQTLQKKEETLKQKDTQVTQKKAEDEGGADMGIVTCHTQLENKSQNEDQKAGEIKRQTEDANEEVENNENSIQETGALHKDAITELQKIAKEPQDGKRVSHETDEQPALNDTQEPPIQVKETEKINETECNKSSEKNEHQKDEDTQQKKKDSGKNQSLENNNNSSCEGKTVLIETNERQNKSAGNKRVHKSNLPESQTQHEDKDRPQLDNTEHLQAEVQDTHPSDVKDESLKQAMEERDTKIKEKECVLQLESSKVNSESQEEEQGETGPELIGDDSDRATDSSGSETA